MLRKFRHWRFKRHFVKWFLDREYTDYLETLAADDFVDVKNFSNMDSGPEKDQFRKLLEKRIKFYRKRGLFGWAEQLEIALDIDDGMYEEKED